MKKIALLSILFTFLISCKGFNDGEFTLVGQAKGIENGKLIVLHKQDDSLGMIPVDTTRIKDGKFTFKGKNIEPYMHAIQIEGINNQNYFVIVESGNANITIDKDSIQKTKVGGTFNNDELQSFTDNRNEIQSEIKKFEYQNQSRLEIAKNENNEQEIKKISDEYIAVQDKMKNFVLNYIKEHPKSYISILLINAMFGEFEPDAVKIENLFNGLDKSLKDHSEGKKIIKRLRETKKVDVGKRAPDFSAKSPEGKLISLKESLGKVTIIDFWASWCGPCRRENPNVVALYNEFHDKGLNIVGVSLDDNIEDWKKAIEKDGIKWTQVSNIKKWSDPIAVLYNVNSIPKTFILNKFGVVVAKDLTGKELKDKVTELLAQN